MTLRKEDVASIGSILAHRKGFYVVGALALCVSLGPFPATVSFLRAVVLQELPYRDEAQLVFIGSTVSRLQEGLRGVSKATYADLRGELWALDDLGLFESVSRTVLANESPRYVEGLAVTPSLLRLLGTQPHSGRLFLEEEGLTGRDDVILLSYGFWQRSFGGDPGIVGSTIRVESTIATVVGVMPREFYVGTTRPQFWIPLTVSPHLPAKLDFCCYAIGRLAGSVDDLNDQLDAYQERAVAEMPQFANLIEEFGIDLQARDLRTQLLRQNHRDVAQRARVFFIAAALVLLSGCATVGGLGLVELESRQSELNTRRVLGAGPRQLAAQLLRERWLLLAMGGGAGLILALAWHRLLSSLRMTEADIGNEPTLDWMIAGGSFVTFLAFGSLFLCVPVTAAVRRAVSVADLSSGRIVHRQRKLVAFVVVQIAVATCVLIGAGSLWLTEHDLANRPIGLDSGETISARVVLPRTPEHATSGPFIERTLEALRRLPGVESASVGSSAPFTDANTGVTVSLDEMRASHDAPLPVTSLNLVMPKFIETLGIPLLLGRTLTEADLNQNAFKVALVDRTFRDAYSDEQEIIGRRLMFGDSRISEGTWYTVVGVVGSVREGVKRMTGTGGVVYAPSSELLYNQRRALSFVVRARSNPENLVGPVRRTLASVGLGIDVQDVQELTSRVEHTLRSVRHRATLLTIMTLMAVGLAGLGTYAVASRLVQQQKRNLGVRAALGASPRQLLFQVSFYVLMVSLAGVLLGAMLIVAIDRLVGSQAFGLTFLSVIGSVGIVIVLIFGATIRPALAAASTDARGALSTG